MMDTSEEILYFDTVLGLKARVNQSKRTSSVNQWLIDRSIDKSVNTQILQVICHFRVGFSLCFKARLSAKHFI